MNPHDGICVLEQEKRLGLNDQDARRRGFIAKGIYSLASLIAGTLAASVGTYLGGTPRKDGDSWSDAGELVGLRPSAPQEIEFERSQTDGWKVRNEKATAWVVLDKREGLLAFSPLCTHLGCAYRWEGRKDAFVCPCHGSEFTANGEVRQGPAGRPLDRYLLKVEGDRLWLGPLQTSPKA